MTTQASPGFCRRYRGGRPPRRFASGVPAARLFGLATALFVAGLSFTPGAQARRASRRGGRLVRPYRVVGTLAERDIPSPDARFVARTRIQEGGVLALAVLERSSSRVLVRLDDVNGFVWVPHREHCLAAAACGEYGKAFLGVWNGGRSWRSLHRVRRPNEECFLLHGVTADGRTAVYGYDPDIDNGSGGPREPLMRRHLRVRLPAR